MTKLHKPKGLAALSIERRKEIARMGGKAAHKSGNAHEYSSEEAKLAVKKRYEPSVVEDTELEREERAD